MMSTATPAVNAAVTPCPNRPHTIIVTTAMARTVGTKIEETWSARSWVSERLV